MAIAGKSQGQIAEWLNGENGSVCYLTMIRKQWKQDTVRRVLRHQNTAELLGEAKAAATGRATQPRADTRGTCRRAHALARGLLPSVR
jgi:predicted nucleic acid-binding Zn ribbon protein